MVTACELKRRFRACGAQSDGACQYCGRAFCRAHGELLEDGEEICARSVYRRKSADLARHLEYKGAVARRNQLQLCGGDCDEKPAGACSKCEGLFCFHHLDDREIEQRRGATVVRVRASLCRHCHNRRRIWSQT